MSEHKLGFHSVRAAVVGIFRDELSGVELHSSRGKVSAEKCDIVDERMRARAFLFK